MNDDRVLRDRLAGLAAAVPVRPSSPTAMVRRPVRLGPALRPASRRSWVLVALVAVLLVAAVGILGSGGQPAYGPVVETVRQGDFELTLRAAKGRYAPDEPIDIAASLAYVGPDPELQVMHARGAGGSPIVFVIREPVFGATLDGIWEASRNRTSLTRGVALDVPFAKSGGWQSPPPEAFQEWLAEPGLQLPSGTWHIAAIADFSVDDVEAFKLEAEIAIAVESDDPSTTTAAVQPSPSEIANPAQSVTVSDGDFELTLRSDKTRYAPGEPIDVTVALTYVGEEPSIETSGSGSGRFFFAIRQLDGDLEMEGLMTMDCRPQGPLTSGHPVERPWGKGAHYDLDDPNTGFYRDWIRDPTLWLPAGTWTFTVSTGFSIGQECRTDGPRLTADLTVAVGGVPAETAGNVATPSSSERATASTEATSAPVQSTSRDAGWELMLEAPRDRYQAGEAIDARITLTNVGVSPDPFLLSQSPLFDLSVVEVGGDRHAEVLSDGGCAPFGYWERGQPQEYRFELRWQNGLTAEPSSFWNDVEGPRLTLPSGTWTLRASARFFGEPCDSPSEIVLDTEITVIVEP